MKNLTMTAAALLLVGMLPGCIAGGAAVALGTAASMVSIAKDVLDVDVSLHSLLGQPKPEQPIPPAALVANPEYVIVTPPPPPAPAQRWMRE